MKTPILLLFITFLGWCSWAEGQLFNNIEYMCPDWGPAMTLPAKEGEKPQFSDTEEEVYFLKQVGTFRRHLVPRPGMGRDEGMGVNIYLCKMKADGSEKTEIKELWQDLAYAISTQSQSTWMDINAKTRQAAISISYAGTDLTGLWVVNLDGTGLKRIYAPSELKSDVATVNHPSWTPDGEWIYFEQALYSTNHVHRIARCRQDGTMLERLTAGPDDLWPNVSPDGKSVLYVHDPRVRIKKDASGEIWAGSTLWLMDSNGANKREILRPDYRPTMRTRGITARNPTINPNGRQAFYIGIGMTILDLDTGKKAWEGAITPYHPGWCQWGKSGLIGYMVNAIIFTDLDRKETKLLGLSRVGECQNKSEIPCRW